MPKVYDQQISWQPTGTQKMQYDRLQDFISPALQNVGKASQNAMDLMREIGDKQAASNLEQAAKDAAFEIENWQDFSEPEKTQDKMVEAAMKKYDDVVANMDYATRNRMNMYNPKAREIYEVKAKEKAADVSYNYAYKTDTANIDSDVGRMITERAPEGPEAVKAYVDSHLAKKQKELRPADYNVYSKAVKANAEKGLIDWYVAYGNLDKAIECVKNDRYAGDINESVRANYLKALTKAKADKNGGDDDLVGNNLVDTLVRGGVPPQEAYSYMTQLTSAIESRYEPDAELIERFGNVPLAGGFSYNQLSNMDYTKAMGIIDKDMKALSKSATLDRESRQQFIPLMVEWERISEPVTEHSSVRQLKKNADTMALRNLYNQFVENGYDSQIKHAGNSDMYKTFTEIGDILDRESSSAELAFGLKGKNLSNIANNPALQKFLPTIFPTPRTPEEAKNWNDPQMQQSILSQKQASSQLSKTIAAVGGYAESLPVVGQMVRPFTKTTENATYDKLQKDLKEQKEKGIITDAEYKAKSRYLWLASEGTASETYPCLTPKTISEDTWNQCLTAYGLKPIDNSAAYDKSLDKGMHSMSADLRAEMERFGHKYDAGTVGDIYQVLMAEINLAVKQGNGDQIGIKYPGLFTDKFLTQVTYKLLTDYDNQYGGLNDLVDLTNNSSLYKQKGGDYEGKSWDPSNPSPETALDITKSKQYQLIGDIERAINKQLGLSGKNQIVFDEETKRNMAMNVRRISSGERHSVETEESKSVQKELKNKRLDETQNILRGE